MPTMNPPTPLRWMGAVPLTTVVLAAWLSAACATSPVSNEPSVAPQTQFEPVPEYPGLQLMEQTQGLPVNAGDSITLGDAPFSLSTHQWVTAELECSEWLNEAHYRQDIVEQVLSSAHFDNCDFEGAFKRIDERLVEARALAVRGKRAEAMRVLGQILHALQDFYAHSNYVELMEQVYPTSLSAVRPLLLWTPEGRAAISQLRDGKMKGTVLPNGMRLFTGVVWWGWPQKCDAGTPSHGEMAKDSLETDNGKKPAPEAWKGRRFHIARQLAQAESLAFLTQTVGRWPELRGACGNALAFTVFHDRRKPRSTP